MREKVRKFDLELVSIASGKCICYLKMQMRQALVKVCLIFFKHFLLYLRNSYFTSQVDL